MIEPIKIRLGADLDGPNESCVSVRLGCRSPRIRAFMGLSGHSHLKALGVLLWCNTIRLIKHASNKTHNDCKTR